MNLGLEIVACALRDGMRPFIEAGLTRDYLASEQDPSHSAVFRGEDRQAWMTLLDHWDRHAKAPSLAIFQRSFPAEAYELPASATTASELIEVWREERQVFLMQLAAEDIATLVGHGSYPLAIDLLASSHRLITAVSDNPSIVVDWDDPQYDLEARIERDVKPGVSTGIAGLDEQFYGYQPGNLICYLGRAKAGKTSFALLSALRAWEDGHRVLFLSFEIAAGKLPSEPGITDRLDCFGAKVDLIKYIMGELKHDKVSQQKLRDFRDMCSDKSFRIVQPTGRYTVTELEADIDRFQPDVVYIDGFYFMSDRITGKPGSNWEGHDNLANELKHLGMNLMIPVIITHQVREKQLTGKKGKGIDDQAMMGGTGIIMYADMVLGCDVDDEDPHNKTHTLTCTRSRLRYLDAVHGRWDWHQCTFHEVEEQVDQAQFGYGKEDSEDAPF